MQSLGGDGVAAGLALFGSQINPDFSVVASLKVLLAPCGSAWWPVLGALGRYRAPMIAAPIRAKGLTENFSAVLDHSINFVSFCFPLLSGLTPGYFWVGFPAVDGSDKATTTKVTL